VVNEQLRESFGRLAYDAYARKAGGRSLVSGDRLPPWDDLDQKIKDAWLAAASAVLSGEITK
jgi:hypothetical protein